MLHVLQLLDILSLQTKWFLTHFTYLCSCGKKHFNACLTVCAAWRPGRCCC